MFPPLCTILIVGQVDLVIPGPEQPLVDGVESHFRKGKHDLQNISSSSHRI